MFRHDLGKVGREFDVEAIQQTSGKTVGVKPPHQRCCF